MLQILEYYFLPSYPLFLIGGNALTSSLTAVEKIISFSQLTEGWDYGSGGPIPERTLRIALTWNERLYNLGFWDTNASPGTDGEVAIGAGWENHYIEVIIEPDDTISVAYDFANKQVFYRLRMLDADAYQTLQELAWQIWTASTSYTQANITNLLVSGREQLLGTMAVLYPSWGANVSLQWGIPSVATSGNIMQSSPELLGSPQSSGNFQLTFYQQTKK
jgi:hypothetical protein